MQIDLRTVTIKAQRQTFQHIEERIGRNKAATRYQEGTYDLQSTANFHYPPTWDPEHDLYDTKRTAIVMRDWYDLKDPRQFYYGAYTMARARQNEAVDSNFDFVESRNLLEMMPNNLKQLVINIIIPLRHLAWGANLNNMYICAYGYGTAITQPCTYHAMDNLGIAQYITRIGLSLDDQDILAQAKLDWLAAPDWQPLRRYVENMLVQKDWFELFIAQNLALDGFLYPLIYENLVDVRLASEGGSAISMLTIFMTDWFKETSKWVDYCVKVAAAESVENQHRLSEWTRHWRDRALAAVTPLARKAYPDDADSVLEVLLTSFNTRMTKLGLEI